MTSGVSSATRLIALLGDPVGHSLSPVFQNAAFRASGVDGVYLALRCVPSDVPGLLRGVALAGGGGNVTLPHKELAALTVDRRTAAVERTGACNTYWAEDGAVCGDNTDVAGVSASIRELIGRAPEGARVLVLGAGGSARAVLAALIDDGAAEVVVANRSRERAAALVEGMARAGRTRITAGAVPATNDRFDLAINATSLGLRPSDPLPISPASGPRIGAALDLVYSPDSTPWVRALRDAGVPAADGLDMLIHQGAAAFERWWSVPAPVAVMRSSLAAVYAATR